MKHDAAVSQGIGFIPTTKGPEERTEIFREHFQNSRVWFAPWLQLAPYECEIAKFPPQETSTGIWKRVKEKDHTLDPCEHIAAQRPRGKKRSQKRKRLWVEETYGVSIEDTKAKSRYFQ